MNYKPGSTYRPSFKFNIKNALILLPITYLLFSVLGIGYGILTNINPLVYINFLLTIIIAFIIYLIVDLFLDKIKSRNPLINLLFFTIASFCVLYNSWAVVLNNQSIFDGIFFKTSLNDIFNYAQHDVTNVSRLGRSSSITIPQIIVLFAEICIVFLIPLIFKYKNSIYYCEACNSNMEHTEKYFSNKSKELKNLDKGELNELTREKPVSPFSFVQFTERKSIYKIDCFHCKTCKESIVDIEVGNTKKDKEEYIYDGEEPIIKGLYVSDKYKHLLH